MHFLYSLVFAILPAWTSEPFGRIRVFPMHMQGETYHAVLIDNVELRISQMPPALLWGNQHLLYDPSPAQVEFVAINRRETAEALIQLFFKGQPLLTNPQNHDLLSAVGVDDVLLRLTTSLPSRADEVNQFLSSSLHLVLARLIEQWVFRQQILRHPKKGKNFFENLQQKFPLTRDGTATAVIFDSKKNLRATLSISVQNLAHPLLSFAEHHGLGDAAPLLEPQVDPEYKWLSRFGIAKLPFDVRVGKVAALERYVLDPEADRILIPLLVLLLESTGTSVMGGPSQSPVRIAREIPGQGGYAIGRYYLETGRAGHALYKKHYGFSDFLTIPEKDVYVLTADREQYLNIWRRFVGDRGISPRTFFPFQGVARTLRVDGGNLRAHLEVLKENLSAIAQPRFARCWNLQP